MSQLVVIDTNVVVSAMLNFSSVPGEVLRRALMGDLIPVLREEIVEEYRDVCVARSSASTAGQSKLCSTGW